MRVNERNPEKLDLPWNSIRVNGNTIVDLHFKVPSFVGQNKFPVKTQVYVEA